MSVHLQRLDPASDREELVAFLCGNGFPFHGRGTWTREQAAEPIDSGGFRSDECDTWWIVTEGGVRAGFIRFEDLEDDCPLFDMRLAEAQRGKGLGRQALEAATQLLFTQVKPHAPRFEGNTRADNVAMRRTFEACGWVQEAHYRQGWPTADGWVDAVLRDDWQHGTRTPIPAFGGN